LPRRAARFDAGAGEPADGQPVDTADLAPWSQAEPALMALMTQWRAGRSGGNTSATRPSSAVKTARHAPKRSAARAVARAPASGIVVQGLPVPAAAADFGDAQPFTLPATALLTTEPVLSTRVSTPQRR
jgi:hypothetical protein